MRLQAAGSRSSRSWKLRSPDGRRPWTMLAGPSCGDAASRTALPAPWDYRVRLNRHARAGGTPRRRELPALGARGVKLQEEEIDRYARLLMEVSRWRCDK